MLDSLDKMLGFCLVRICTIALVIPRGKRKVSTNPGKRRALSAYFSGYSRSGNTLGILVFVNGTTPTFSGVLVAEGPTEKNELMMGLDSA